MFCAPCITKSICLKAKDAYIGSGVHNIWIGLKIKCPLCSTRVKTGVCSLLPQALYDIIAHTFQPANQQQQQFVCPVCESFSGRLFDVTKHIITACPKNTYVCSFCNTPQPLRGDTRDAFNTHFETCNGLLCPYHKCSFRANKARLTKHIKLHKWADDMAKQMRRYILKHRDVARHATQINAVVEHFTDIVTSHMVSDEEIKEFNDIVDKYELSDDETEEEEEDDDDDDGEDIESTEDEDDDDDSDDSDYIPSSSSSSEEDADGEDEEEVNHQ
jgi:hypothetical protein